MFRPATIAQDKPMVTQLLPRPGQMAVQVAGLGSPPRLAQMASEQVLFRFEVKNEAGEFVPNASVSMAFEDGTHIITKLTDAGGNVSFTEAELLNALTQAGLMRAEGVAWYTVEAPGYQMAEDMIWDPTVPAEQQQKRLINVTLMAAVANGVPGAPNYIAAGVTTALLIALGLAV